MDTFLGGIDLEASSRLKGFFKKTIELQPEKIINAIEKNTNIQQEVLEEIKDEIKLIINNNDEFIKKFEDEVESIVRESSNPILESVSVLPKEELANICESLIHITSLKRKIASDLETVVGKLMLLLYLKVMVSFGKKENITLILN